MTDDGGMFAESIAAAAQASAELRQLIREAHEARADLRAARREVETSLASAQTFIQTTVPSMITEGVRAAITAGVATEMERLKEDVGKTIDKAKDAIEKSFARLARYYMYGTEDPDETTPSLTDMTVAMRTQRGLQPGQIMPAAFRPRSGAGKKTKR